MKDIRLVEYCPECGTIMLDLKSEDPDVALHNDG